MSATDHKPVPPAAEDSQVFARAAASVILVLLGGVFAGLTIGLMGQDEVYLQVTAETGDEAERRCAAKVLKLLSKGKHWVLVTLLLSNVITNETLPIVLDRLLGGGWPAVVSSTAAIVVFGEIIPQSICVRYGLPLGAFFAPFVKVLMYAMYPLAVPIARVLDLVLGEDHGTIYKKAGLKSLVTLHHHMGMERLNEDEVTIISAVLDLKDKPVSHIMTPVEDVFVLSSDTILDEKVVEKILLTGFNRIPIHVPNEPLNFVGMLLVRTLITYDPDDALPISSFALATLPETAPDTSCLNILNYFQEGKAHMVAVSTDPGAVTGAVGVVTLEDVIEELIGEEIVDESDVYVDVHRAIRRVTPAPMLKSSKHAVTKASQIANSQKITSLRPSNRASDPKATHNSKITIKRGATNTRPRSGSARAGSPRIGSPLLNGIRQGSRAGSPLLGGSHLGSRAGSPRPGSQPSEPPAFVSTAIVQDLTPYSDDERGTPDAEDAKSSSNVVVKQTDDDVNVMSTERDAIESNLGPEGPIKAMSPRQPSPFHRRTGSRSSRSSRGILENGHDDEERTATFSENVVYVNGMNKVVIQDISTSDEDSISSGSSRKHRRKDSTGKKSP